MITKLLNAISVTVGIPNNYFQEQFGEVLIKKHWEVSSFDLVDINMSDSLFQNELDTTMKSA